MRYYLIFSAMLMSLTTCEAAFVVRDGWVYSVDEQATLTPQEHFALGCRAIDEEDWREAAKQFNIVLINFPDSPFEQDSLFFSGVADFEIGEFDTANRSFTDYLKGKNNPRYFQEAVEYKFAIAEQFRCGAKRRPFGTKQLPKCLSGTETAIEIYDDVIAALPSQEIAAQAFYAKGCMLWSMKEWRPAIDAFQSLIRRFPKYELTPDAYLSIIKVYLEQSICEFQNPDLLAFAELTTRKFKEEFPREERATEAEEIVHTIKEVYAKGLYDTGRFYERTCHIGAAIIYYESAINRFPETTIAACSRDRLKVICPGFLEFFDNRKAAEQKKNEAEEFSIEDFES